MRIDFCYQNKSHFSKLVSLDSMIKKWFKITLVMFVSLLILGFVGIHFFGAYMLISPLRLEMNESYLEDSFGTRAIPVNIYTEDSLKLSSYHIKNDKNTNGTFIICHGIGSCKEHQVSLAKWLDYLGYNSFLFDGRAHGKSEGEFCTYGFKEKKDISIISDYLKNQGEEVYILGTSLGGAVALQALEYDSNISGGVIISTFSTLREVSIDYQERLTNIGWQWLNDYVVARAEKIAHFKADDVQPLLSCKNISQPVFIGHGKKDVHIDYNCAQRNYEALTSKSKDIVLVENAAHNNVWQIGGKDFERKLVDFIRENF